MADLDRPKGVANPSYIPTLDGWRAIAVLLVIGAHCVPMLYNQGSRAALVAVQLFHHAGFGVDIFFALSGFLITSLLLIEAEKYGRISAARFYTRRFFRIIPPMAVYLAVVALLACLSILPGVTVTEMLGSVLFFRNYTVGSWYTAHFWSLSVEEHFYAVMPLLILTLRPRTLLIVSLALILACIGARWYEQTYDALSTIAPQFRTESRVDALLWGSVFAQLSRRPDWAVNLRKLLVPWVTALLIVITGAALFAIDSEPVRRTITALMLPILIMATVYRPESIAGRLLELRVVKFIGRLSYSLYIWQMLFLIPMVRPLGLLQSFPLALILPFVMAWLSFRFVEMPFIRLGHRLSNSMRRAPAAVTAYSPV